MTRPTPPGIPHRLTAAALFLFWLAAGSSARAENIVYPPDAGVLNVRAAPYFAKGDGRTDDTRAIQKALAEGLNRHKIVYLPNGTYRVSATLRWNDGTNGDWNGWGRYLSIQGQSRSATIIKLQNGVFTNAARPQAVVYTASGNDFHAAGYRENGSGNQAFENSLYNLTINTGRNNPGAVGLDYQVSNWGALRDVAVRSGDKRGVAGILLTRRDNGPGLLKNIVVDGFDTAIEAGQEICHVTMEHVQLSGQRRVGIEQRAAVFAIRDLVSVNRVPALRASRDALLSLLGARLTGGDPARAAVEIADADTHAVLRDIVTAGYNAAVLLRGKIVPGHARAAWNSDPVLGASSPRAARLPVRETPAFFDPDLLHWAGVRAFGPDPNFDKNEDDTVRVQAAMNSGKSVVYFPGRPGAYRLSKTIVVPSTVRHILGLGAAINTSRIPPGEPAFHVRGGGSKDQTIIERLQIGGRGIAHEGARTLILKDLQIGGFRNGPNAGPLFVENVCGAPWRFDHPQSAWLRQLNPEGNFAPAVILNNGATLWILGLKTETGSTLIQTQAAGRTELWGGFAYTFGVDPAMPAFVVDDATVSLSFCGTTYQGDKGFYTTLVREQRGGGGQPRTLTRAQAFGRGGGASLPLYVSIANPKTNAEKSRRVSPMRPNSRWLQNARYGIFVHFLPGGDGWQKAISSFDVEAFAADVTQAGAAYVVFTLGQNNGYYCAPNAVYEKYAGYAPFERCARRDLPMELADALKKRGVRFLLYLPSRAPQQDARAMRGLSDVSEQQPAPQEFTRKWSEVIREWSERYKTKVSGWWFDGAYNTAGWDDLTKPFNWKTWAAACRAGNPDSLLAFNPGTDRPRAFTVLCDEQDYTAGEQNEWTATPQQFPAPPGVVWQVLSFLGSSWAKADGPHVSDAAMIAYVRQVIAQNGVVTCDVNVSDMGRIFAPHLQQLADLRAAVR